MKKAIFFAGLAAALCFTGCNKEADLAGNGKKVQIILSNVDTRTVNQSMSTVWAADDELSVFYAPAGTTTWSSNTKFTVTDAAANTATGEVELTASAYDWYLFYPYTRQLPNPTTLNPEGSQNERSGYTTIGGQFQTQAGDGDMAHLAGAKVPVYGNVKNVAATDKPVVTMKNAAAVVRFAVQNKLTESIHVLSVKFTAPEDIVGTYYIDFSGDEATLVGSGENYVFDNVTITNGNPMNIAADVTPEFYAVIKPFTAPAGSKLKVEIEAESIDGAKRGSVTKEVTLTEAAAFQAGKIKTLNLTFDGTLQKVTAEPLPFAEVFDGGAGSFSIDNVTGSGIWNPATVSGQKCMKGTSYGTSYTAAESWLVSPEIDGTTAKDGIKLSFKQCINKYFGTVANEATLWACEKDGDWKQITISYPTPNGTWSAFEEQVVDLSEYMGKVFQFAFKYVSTADNAGTWEVADVAVTDETVAAYTFLAELEGPEEVAANITSVTIKVTGNVAWTAEPSEGVTLDKTSGEGNATITASFAANTATTPKNYSVMVRTDNTLVDNDEWEITFTQAAASSTAKAYPYEETFASSQGDFTIDNVKLGEGLTYVWKHDATSKYMKASAYVGGNKESESWLISPLVDLKSATEPTLYFSQCINKYFGDVTKEATVWIKQEGGEWAQLAISYPEITSGNWSPMTDYTVDIKSYAGKKVQVAFKYTSSTEAAGTWEVKKFKLDEAVNGPVDPTFTVPSSLTVEEGKTAKISVTTNTDGAITYTSASTAVATVAADGTVTGVAAGTTTVTVAAAATDTYNAASATVAVTVTAAQTGTHYGRVNTITSGKKYLIAGGNQQKVLGTISNNKAAGVDVEITDGKIVSNETTDALAVTITAADGKYSIVLANGKYLVYTGSSTNLTAASSASDTWTVGEGAQGMFRFTSTKTEGRALSFRASTYNVFGAYSANNINGTEYFDIDLYELGAEPVEPNQPSEITTSISMPGNQTVYIGESFELNATSNVEAATITYESEDPTIATVSASGTVTGVAEGSVKVYARIAGVEGKYTSAERYCNVTVSKKPDVVGGTWEATSLSAIADGAEFILVSTKEDASYAMSNENGTASAPAAVSVTISSNTISNPSSNIIFVMKKAENGYIFQLPGDEGKWVYTTTSNNGIRVGTGDKNLFNLDSESGYLIINDGSAPRYLGVYNNADWRSYTSVGNNIKDQTFTFFVKK